MVVWMGYFVYCVFVLFFGKVIWISQWQKEIGARNFACMLTYYPDRSSPLLVKIGSRGVTGAALLCVMYVATEASLPGPMEGGSVEHWELRAAALLKDDMQ